MANATQEYPKIDPKKTKQLISLDLNTQCAKICDDVFSLF